jgi:RNA recognition motif-containing protein
MRLYVGNLARDMTEGDLQQMFGAHGTVRSAQVITDRGTGRSKGFGFVEMESGEQAQTAIKAMNGQDVNGRALSVKEARPREDRLGNSRGNGDGGGRPS